MTAIHCKYDDLVFPDSLSPFPNNTNEHPPAQIELLTKIILYQGWRHPIIISNLSKVIVAGHGRWMAALNGKWDQVPIVYQDFENKEQEYAFLESDNHIAELSEHNLDLMWQNLESLPDLDLEMLGMPNLKLPEMEKLSPGCEEDETPELPKDTIVKKGELFELGDHRLLCGDATMIDDVDRLMGGQKADMVFTDPPYGMNLNTDFSSFKGTEKLNRDKGVSGGNKYEKVIGDNTDFDPGIIFGYFDYCKEIFLWGADYYSERIIDKNKGSWFIWDKRIDETMDKVFGSCFELCWSKQKHKRQIARVKWSGMFGTEKEFDRKRVHPTQKPMALVEWFFDKFKGDVVVDLFGGSGSTLIACEKINRKCFMMEIDPKYCDVIINRWQKFSNKKAYLINEDGSKTSYDDLKEVLNGKNGPSSY